MRKTILLSSLLLLTAASMNAQSYSGTYTIQAPEGVIRLTLRQDSQGSVQGTLTSGGVSFAVQGGPEAPGISGLVTGPGTRLGFVARHQDALLYVKLFSFTVFGQPDYNKAQTFAFARQADAPGATQPSYGPATAQEVVINGTRLSPERLQAFERQYQTRIPAGRYWYDARCGAWGLEGGPTVGFIMAGLDLPGPMPPNISGSGTGIFINGREIHIQDQMALHQMLGVTYPGRYWLDAQGNLGIEGGRMLVNLVAASQRAGGSSGRGGITSGMGGTVGVDGSGGVMFFDRNASGGYTSYTN